MSLRVERYKILLTIRPNAVNRMHSASRLLKYRLHDREKLEACTKTLPVEAALPIVIISRRYPYSDERAFPSLGFLYAILLYPSYLNSDLVLERSAMMETRTLARKKASV